MNKMLLRVLSFSLMAVPAFAAPDKTPMWGYDTAATIPSGNPLQYKIGSTWQSIPLLDQYNNWTSRQRWQNTDFYNASASKPAGDAQAYKFWYDSSAPFVFAAPNSQNSVIGAIYQNNSSSLSYPTGVTGYAMMDNVAVGNTAFGGFFRCDAYSVGGCVGAEFNTFNYSGNANAVFPPVTGPYPILTNEHNAVQVVNYGSYTSKVGILINSGISGYGYQAGIYLNPMSSNSYGVFVDSNYAVGPVTAGQFNTTGVSGSVNLGMQMKNPPTGGSKFIKALDVSGNEKFTIDGNGNTVAAGYILGVDAIAQKSSLPSIRWNETGGAVDEKIWDFINVSGELRLRAANDSFTSSNTALSFFRTGYSVTQMNVFEPIVVSNSSGTTAYGKITPNAIETFGAYFSEGSSHPTTGGTCSTIWTGGGMAAGQVRIAAAGGCAVGTTIVLSGMPNAPSIGYACDAHNLLTGDSYIVEGAGGTGTSVSFSILNQKSNLNDTIVWKCVGY